MVKLKKYIRLQLERKKRESWQKVRVCSGVESLIRPSTVGSSDVLSPEK